MFAPARPARPLGTTGQQAPRVWQLLHWLCYRGCQVSLSVHRDPCQWRVTLIFKDQLKKSSCSAILKTMFTLLKSVFGSKVKITLSGHDQHIRFLLPGRAFASLNVRAFALSRMSSRTFLIYSGSALISKPSQLPSLPLMSSNHCDSRRALPFKSVCT